MKETRNQTYFMSQICSIYRKMFWSDIEKNPW